MSSRLFVVLLFIALSSAYIIPSDVGTRLIEGDSLSTYIQKYLHDQFANFPDDEEVIELEEPPLELQEAAADLFREHNESEGQRTKRRVVVCRIVAVRDKIIGKVIVVVRCPK